MNIYDRIKELRIKNGMSQYELALKVGYEGRSAISKVEQGKRNISQSMIVKYANALGVTPAYLMGWEDGNVYHCPDDENPWILKICEIMESSEIDTQIAICRKAESIIRGEEEPEELTDQERALLRLFRDTTEEGRMRMIQSVLNIHDTIVKRGDTTNNTDLA